MRPGACDFREAMLGARRKSAGPFRASGVLPDSNQAVQVMLCAPRVSASSFQHAPWLAGERKWHLVDEQTLAGSISAAGLPGRYAAALFGLATEQKTLNETATALAMVQQAIAESDDFRALTTAPQVRRDVAAGVVAKIAAELQLPSLVANFLGVVAQNGRLKEIPAIIRAFSAMTAAHTGTLTAQVTSAQKLTAAQVKALQAKLKARTGQTTQIDAIVDPAILGGLVVRIGSEQIDSSVRTRLEKLGQHMKGHA